MICLAWNARGLGNQRALRDFRRLVAKRRPSLVFICETKLYQSQFAWWRTYFPIKGLFAVDCDGRKGGLVLIWNDPLDVKICSYLNGHIDCVVSHDHYVWRFTGFYGNPIPSSRVFSWNLLKKLCYIPELNHLPWLVGGDFNEILYESEKFGGSMRSLSQMSAFREVLNLCRLNDLNFIGDKFTWSNKRHNNGLICERLDRFLCNNEWHYLFPMAEVLHLDYYSSDHRPISVNLKMGCEVIFRKRQKRFMFEHKWMMEEDFKLIMDNWLSQSEGNDLPRTLFKFSGILKEWAGSRFSDLSRKIESLRKELDALMNPLKASSNERRINELENIIEKLVMQEEMHWKQRARTNWLAQGDGNTKFFHSFASQRKRSNHIKGLIDDNGQWVEAEKDIADVMLNFFANLFSSNHPSAAEIEEATKNISPLVDEAMNEILLEPYTESDIYKALFDMHLSKAPGPDGFTALFFQKNWSIVGREVVSACLNILNDRGELDGWNETNITLIPKVAAPGNPSDFRPISLCNTCYKVVARAITNRLRPILGLFVLEGTTDSTRSTA